MTTMAFDRRRFLVGAGGACLALPMLRAFAPARAHAQARPPKRLVVVVHSNGRIAGNGRGGGDWWSPGPTSGPLPPAGMAPSRLLAPLAAIRDEIVTIDGIDNVVRHASGDGDGHATSTETVLTCRLSGSPSFDHVAGTRLRSGPGMRPSIVFPGSAYPVGTFFEPGRFYGEGGSAPFVVSGNPEMAIEEVFGAPAPGPDPARPTLRQRLLSRRRSLLDGVARELMALRGRLDARDRAQLDRHAQFVEDVQARLGGGATVSAMGCTRPDRAAVPHVVPSTWDEFVMTGRNPAWERGRQDPVTIPHQIENLVQALACDVTRSAALVFQSDPSFASEFPSGETPFADDGSYHSTIHGIPRISESMAAALACERGFLFFARAFTSLVQRLAEIEDTDGSRVLDNTLVLWTSELGYGSEHTNFNLPVVLAGLGTAFAKGRHLVETGRTTGDLYAHLLRLLGGSDTTFGDTGTLGSLASARGASDLYPSAGRPDAIDAGTPLHGGPLSL